MNNNIGKFIVIDGSDGSGKKTQSDLLIEKLESQGIKTAYYDFPNYDSFFGQMIARYLNGEFGEADQVNPYLGSLLYAGDRWLACEAMKNDLKEGKIVISNRYTQSNMGHQAAKIMDPKEKEKFIAWLYKLEFEVYQIPKPDLVIFLHVPVEISQSLFEKKGKRNYTSFVKDIHEKNVDYMKRSVNEYLRLSEIYPEWRRIDCTKDDLLLSKEEIASKVFALFKEEFL
jgi:dTMP kinase